MSHSYEMERMNLQLFGAEENETIEMLDEMKADWQMKDNILAVEVAKLTQLRRIADSLDILSHCVGYMPPRPYQKEGHSFFRIGGSVGTE